MNDLSSILLAKSELASILTVVVFVLLSLLNSWIQKRRAQAEAEKDEPWPAPRDPQTSPRPRAPDPMEEWQEELRRLLKPTSSPPPVPQPSPVRRSVPSAPTYQPVPPVVAQEEEGPNLEMPPLLESRNALERATQINDQVTARMRQVSSGLGSGLVHGDEAVEQAARLEFLAQEQIRAGIARSASSSGTRPTAQRSPDADTVVQMFTRPNGLRQAVLASLILAPPKSLEPRS